MTAPSYYGCTGAHSEFTCLSAYYVGPRRYKKVAAWCPSCREKYAHPTDQQMTLI
jgi:hypothetical protein